MYYGERHLWEPMVRKIHQVRDSRKNNGGGEGGTFMWTEPTQRDNTKWTGWFSK